MTPRIVDKETKKKEIMLAALPVFACHGVAKTKMADIAVAAGVGKGTIYEYFRSKEEIFAEGFNHIFQQTELAIAEALKSAKDPVQKLQLIIEVSLKNLIDLGEDFMGIMMDFWAEGIRNKDSKILEQMNLKKLYQDYRALFSGILQEGMQQGIFRQVDTLMVSALMIAAFDGLLLQWIMEPGIFDINQISQQFADCFLNGLLK